MCGIRKEIRYILASRILRLLTRWLRRKHKMFRVIKLYKSEFNSGYNVKVNLKPRAGVKPVFFL